MKKEEVFFGRRMKDLRFRKNENLILKTFVGEREEKITVRKFVKELGFSRSTMYLHHHAMKEIIPDYERYILAEYSSMMRRKIRKKNVQLKTLYLDMLVFILRNQKIFEMFLEFDDRVAVAKMVYKLENKIVSFARLSKTSRKILKVYISEVVEIIFEWGRGGFTEKELEDVLADIMYLTQTCRERLGPIER